jgi:hypothetical protein
LPPPESGVSTGDKQKVESFSFEKVRKAFVGDIAGYERKLICRPPSS